MNGRYRENFASSLTGRYWPLSVRYTQQRPIRFRLALAFAKRCPIGLDPRQYRQASGETLGRPIRFTFVVFRHRWNVRGNFNPRLFGSGKDVYVRWQVIWLIKRTDANKPDDRTGTGVVAPYRYSALWAACNLLPFPAIRGSVDDFRLPTYNE